MARMHSLAAPLISAVFLGSAASAQEKAQEIDGKAIVYPHRRTAEVLSVGTWTTEDEQAYLEAGR